MTETERKKAERLALEYSYGGHNTGPTIFVDGYIAGRESLRAEHSDSHRYRKTLTDLQVERERSQKLIEILHSIDRRAGSASHQSGWTDAMEVAEWARKAIVEYEASLDP